MRLAIIPARSGSKRLKNKNIKLYNKKPMIFWTINAAKRSKIFDYIFVSTNSKKIQKISKLHGAKCSFLRTNYVNDSSTTDQVVFDVLRELKIKKNLKFKEVFLLMPTCPNRTFKDLKNFNNFLKKESNKKIVNFASTIVEYPHFLNPTFSLFKKNDKKVFLFPKKLEKKSNKIEKFYTLTGSIRYAKVNEFLKEKSFLNKKTIYINVPFENSIDIDTEEDFKLALKLRKN